MLIWLCRIFSVFCWIFFSKWLGNLGETWQQWSWLSWIVYVLADFLRFFFTRFDFLSDIKCVLYQATDFSNSRKIKIRRLCIICKPFRQKCYFRSTELFDEQISWHCSPSIVRMKRQNQSSENPFILVTWG